MARRARDDRLPGSRVRGQQPAGSTIYGNPTSEAHDIPRDQVPAFCRQANGTIDRKYNHYLLEAVQQIGADSFAPGHGVLLSKVKNAEGQSCGTFSCFVWIIDAHDVRRLPARATRRCRSPTPARWRPAVWSTARSRCRRRCRPAVATARMRRC